MRASKKDESSADVFLVIDPEGAIVQAVSRAEDFGAVVVEHVLHRSRETISEEISPIRRNQLVCEMLHTELPRYKLIRP